MEEWKDIEGLEGYCQVSSYGRVRELDNGSWSLLDPELNGKYGSKPLVNLIFSNYIFFFIFISGIGFIWII